MTGRHNPCESYWIPNNPRTPPRNRRFASLSWFLGAFLITAIASGLPRSALADTVSGTGFFVTEDGYLVTNAHVIAGRSEISIRTLTGDQRPVTVVRVDERNDLALLKAEGRFGALPVAPSDVVKRGARVVTVGFPNIDVQGLEPKLTEGIVSSLTGIRDEPRTFQITVQIQPGNSGGPLVTEEGNVVGVVVAKLDARKMLAIGGSIPEGVNYAVKSNYLRELINSVGSVRTNLLLPSQKKQTDLSALNEKIERATVLIIARSDMQASEKQATTETPKKYVAPPGSKGPVVAFATSVGDILVELYPDAAPKTVEHFLAYVKSKQFDGTQFHRVIPGFMIQAGGFTADFTEKPTPLPPIPHEGESSRKAGLSNVPGTLSMARTSDPQSANAQFFINVADNSRLNFREASPQGYGYTVFGKVVDGMDVVNKIAATPTGPGGRFPTDVPKTLVLIKSATVVTP